MIPGIDVSHFNGEIDWLEVAASGVRFAYIKATEGTAFEDPRLSENRYGAKQHGIPYGQYHFLTDADLTSQARNFLQSDPFAAPLPPVIDIELASIIDAMVFDFLEELGPYPSIKMPILYIDPALIDSFGSLTSWPLWIAEYDCHTPKIEPWKTWTFWQWSQTGKVPGISGDVDLDWFNGNDEEFLEWLKKK